MSLRSTYGRVKGDVALVESMVQVVPQEESVGRLEEVRGLVTKDFCIVLRDDSFVDNQSLNCDAGAVCEKRRPHLGPRKRQYVRRCTARILCFRYHTTEVSSDQSKEKI